MSRKIIDWLSQHPVLGPVLVVVIFGGMGMVLAVATVVIVNPSVPAAAVMGIMGPVIGLLIATFVLLLLEMFSG